MKHAKKLMALLMALTMLLSLTVTAFATGEGTITVDNPQADQTYTAYKIFDVTYNEGKTAYSYTIDSSSVWFSTIQSYATDANGLKLEQVTGTTTYIVSTTEAFSAPAFAAVLKAKVVGDAAVSEIVATGTQLTTDGTGVSAKNLPLGYYFVTSSTGALCNLTTTNPSVTIHDKNDVPFDKVDDLESVLIGEVVNYTITGKVPDTTGFTTYDYVITDKMSEGLTINKTSIKVEIYDGSYKTLDTAYYDLVTENAKSFDGTKDVDFRINFKPIDMNSANPSLVGKEIRITYSATVNEGAVGKIEHNHATLTYSNNPTDSTKHGTRTDDETVYSAKIIIDKYQKGASETKLSGAKFVLYVLRPDIIPTSLNSASSEAGMKRLYYVYVPATATEPSKVTWSYDVKDATVVTTNEVGYAEFLGLKDSEEWGNYYLLETEAPAGYNKLAAPVEITITGKNADGQPVEANLTHTENVENETGTLLPSTGGMGTTIFYVVGSVLLVGAAVLLITKKRMSAAR